ncbi:MAG: hypothetical protein ACE366_12550 [Bradymonadia bacterium]
MKRLMMCLSLSLWGGWGCDDDGGADADGGMNGEAGAGGAGAHGEAGAGGEGGEPGGAGGEGGAGAMAGGAGGEGGAGAAGGAGGEGGVGGEPGGVGGAGGLMPPAARWVDLEAGRNHICALDEAGGVWCWGDNGEGQSGPLNPEKRGYGVPVSVPVGEPVTTLVLAVEHSCGLTAEGAVWCWGNPDYVGHDEGAEPAPVEGLPPVVELVAGDAFTCARTEGGEIWCWGSNRDGRLGTGRGVNRDGARQVDAQVLFVHVAAGERHACGLTEEGDAYCWGVNDGRYPGNSEESFETPQYVDTFTAQTRFEFVGSITCTRTGEPRAWQLDCGGRLGHGAFLRQAFYDYDLSPYGGLCVVTVGEQEVVCVGDNTDGRLGLPPDRVERNDDYDPVGRLAPNNERVAVGRLFACVLDEEGGVHCWGNNQRGQLGDDSWPSPLSEDEAMPIEGGRTYIDLAAGENHGCGVTDQGDVYCWGINSSGQTGQFRDDSFDPAPGPGTIPARVELPEPAVQVSAGRWSTCALLADEALWCWGAFPARAASAPRQVVQDRVSDIDSYLASDVDHQYLAVAGSTLLVYGDDRRWHEGRWPTEVTQVDASASGWLCTSSPEEQLWCGRLTGSQDDIIAYGDRRQFAAVSVGEGHACGLQADGRAFCWGGNESGQLGDGTREARERVAPVLEAPAFTALKLWRNYTVAQTAAGETWLWGGLPENGVDPTRPRPSHLLTTVDLSTVSRGWGFTCGVRLTDGEAICWGEDNTYGQLGNGAVRSRWFAEPVHMPR